MAWKGIPNNPHWQYNDAPADPGANSPYRPLWLKQTAGVRTNSDGNKVYTMVRKVGDTSDNSLGEISKTFWDADGNDLKFQMEVEVESPSDFTIPCQEDGGVEFDATIDWGDGTTTTTTTYNGAGLTHTYAAAGRYKIMIGGTFPNIFFNGGGDKLLVQQVLNLGHVGWTKLNNAFQGCANLIQFSAGSSDTSNVTSFISMLQGCVDLTVPELGFSTSSAQRIDAFFFQDDGVVDVSGIQNWDITSLTVTPADHLNLFMIGPTKMSTATYDALLVNWEGQNPANTVGMGRVKFGASQFTLSSAAATAKQVLADTYGWTITDGGGV